MSIYETHDVSNTRNMSQIWVYLTIENSTCTEPKQQKDGQDCTIQQVIFQMIADCGGGLSIIRINSAY